MGYRVYYKFDNGETEQILDGVFETVKEAEEAAVVGVDDYKTGGDYLREAGEECCEEQIVGWTIVKE